MINCCQGSLKNVVIEEGYNRRVKTIDSHGSQYSFYTQSGTLLATEKDGYQTNYIYLGKRLIAKSQDASTPPLIQDTASNSRQHRLPFGETIEAPKNDIGYTGHKFDTDLGLSYMQQRYYDPAIGRFYSNDPIGFRDVHSFNRYGYGNNNPYRFTDPTGLISERGEFFSGCSEHTSCLDNNSSGWTPPSTGATQNKWDTTDFVKHYFFGGGKAVNLSDVGLAFDFENAPSVQSIANGFMSNTFNVPIFNSIYSTRGYSDVTNIPGLFSVGNSDFYMQAICSAGACDFTFSIQDAFKDPLDIFDSFSGEFEIGAPYEINHSWQVQRSYGQ